MNGRGGKGGGVLSLENDTGCGTLSLKKEAVKIKLHSLLNILDLNTVAFINAAFV